MNNLLMAIAIVGAWNLISFIGRIYYKEISYQYVYHIFIGIWATILLIGGDI